MKLSYHGVIYSKKNNKRIVTSRRTHKPIIISSTNSKNNEMKMAWEFREQALKEKWAPKDDGNYHIGIKIWEKDRTKRDLDNQATSLLDALVLANVIPDDSVGCVVKITVEYMGIDKYDPHADITITEVSKSA